MAVQRLKLVGNILTRKSDTSKDQFFKNCYPEAVDGENFFVVKRPGLEEAHSFTAGAGRGVYNWRGDLFSVTGNTIRKGSSTIGTINTTTGPVYFTEIGGGSPLLVVQDKTDAWIINTSDALYLVAGGSTTYSDWVLSTAYTIADRVVPTTANGFFYEATTTGSSNSTEPTWPTTLGDTVVDSGVTWECKGYYTNYPTSIVDGIAFLDQYVFVLDDKGTVWNSVVSDPTSWEATDFITAEGEPDAGVAITTHYNYVIAFGEYTVEFFYDAANASGSPLDKVDASIIHIGCAAGQSVQKFDNTVMWIGQDRSGGKRIYMLEGTSQTPVSSKPVERLLNAEGSTIVNATSFVVRTEGHTFYAVTLPTLDKTIVYDNIDKVWCEWTSYNGTMEGAFEGKYVAEVGGVYYVQHESNGKIYTLDVDVYQDDGNAIKVEGVTDLFDGDVSANKFQTRLEVVGDEAASTSTLSISYTDDNYKTFSTPRDVDLSDRAFLTRLGRFQRRAYKYTHEANTPMRLEAFDLNVDLGEYGE